MLSLPPLPEAMVLADACREVGATERLPPAAVEKDFYLTRLIWSLAKERGDQLLLKGGTCLSKCDLGYRRLSEDVDMVIPLSPDERPGRHKGINATQLNHVREALRAVAPSVGLLFRNPSGDVSARGAHVIWTLSYASEFGPQSITVEASLRPVLLPPRRATLKQLLGGQLAAGTDSAYCWALDQTEVRAEKVRAALTRNTRAIRDFYDLALLLDFGVDLSSPAFVELVDRKLTEVDAPPLAAQPPRFGLSDLQLATLAEAAKRDLPLVVRVDEPPFDLESLIARFDSLWGKRA